MSTEYQVAGGKIFNRDGRVVGYLDKSGEMVMELSVSADIGEAPRLPVTMVKGTNGNTFYAGNQVVDLSSGDSEGGGGDSGGGTTPTTPVVTSDYTYSTLWKDAKILSGVHRLNPDYTGPLLRLREEATNTEQDFSDVTSARGKRAVTKFAKGSGLRLVTAYDQSGNGNHQTQTEPTEQPAFIYHGGEATVTCRSYDGRDRKLPLPAGFTVDKQATTMLQLVAVQSGIQPQQTFEFGTGSQQVLTPSLTPATQMNVQLKENGAIRSIGDGMHSIPGTMTEECVTIRLSTLNVAYRTSRGHSGTNAPCAAGTYTGGFILGAGQDWPGYSFKIKVWALWGRAIYDLELPELEADCFELGACRGYGNLVNAGDSIAEGIVKDKPGSSYTTALKGHLHPDTLVRSMGRSGQLLTEITTAYDTYYAPLYVPGMVNVLMVTGGTNNFLVANSSSADVIASATDLSTRAKITGFKTVFCTILPAGSEAYDATKQANRQAYNNWLRNTAVQSGIIDSVIDLEALECFKSAANLRWLPDKLHPSGYAYRAAAPYIAEHLQQYGFMLAGDATGADF